MPLTVLITGVSRQRGIGAAAADRLQGDGWMSPELEREAALRNPLRRHGRPQYAADRVALLLRQDAGFINGQVITSDGGHGIAGGSWPR